MKQMFKKYIWLWEMIGAGLILALSIVIAFNNMIVPLVVGILFVVLGLLRISPLVKTTDDKILRVLYPIDLAIEIIIGTLLIIYAFMEDNSFTRFIATNGHYLIGGVLYLRGFVYFFSTNIRSEEYPPIYFITNIICLTLGVIMIIKQINIEDIRWFIFALGILCVLFVGYSGYKGYKNYRGEYAVIRETKKIQKNKELECNIDKQIEESINIDNINPETINIDDSQDETNV